MTICIASITEDSKIIATTDKMVTVSAAVTTTYELEEHSKVVNLTDRVIALLAGDIVQSNEILKAAMEKIGRKRNVLDIATVVQKAFKEYRIKMFEEHFLGRFDMDLKTFKKSQSTLDPKLVDKLNEALGTFNLNAEILITGIDSGPHLYLVVNPGVIINLDSIGYAAIGSGSQHATLSLIGNKQNSKTDEGRALYNIIEAKKRAEADPGVGELCDIIIINRSVGKIPKEKVEKCIEIYSKSFNNITDTKENFATKLKQELKQ